jgi:hypothetical protein
MMFQRVSPCHADIRGSHSPEYVSPRGANSTPSSWPNDKPFHDTLFNKNAALYVGLQTEFFTPPLADGVDMVHDFDQSKSLPLAVEAYLKRRLTA